MNETLSRRCALVIFGLLSGSPVRWRRTQGRPPFHPSSTLDRSLSCSDGPASHKAPFQCPRSRAATLELRGRLPGPYVGLTVHWAVPTQRVRPAGDPVDSDPGARFPGPTLDRAMCHHTRPTVSSRMSVPLRPLNFDRFHWPCELPGRIPG